MSNHKELLERWLTAWDSQAGIKECKIIVEETRALLSQPDTIATNNEKVNINLLEENERMKEWINRTGDNHHICTYDILRQRCSDCGCWRKK